MSEAPVAFYAPMKSPDHPVPSGDRAMARLLLDALALAGMRPSIASRVRTFEPAGDPACQGRIAAESAAEAERLARSFAAQPPGERPRAWFTYHCYYKAPDLIGPIVAARLGIPYVVAEGSRAPGRATGRWSGPHRAAEAALDAAALLLVITANDRPALEAARPPGQRLVDLPPFIRSADWRRSAPTPDRASGPVRLLSVGMMRAGDKLASYRILADALAAIRDADWTIDLVGDGPAAAEVRQLFAAFGRRATSHGELPPGRLAALYREADLFVWPAVNEAYGMVLLEAQAAGCPVVAGDFGGVASALEPGRTGLLTPPGDAAAFAGAVAGLIRAPDRRRAMSAAAASFAAGPRDVSRASATIRDALEPLIRTAEAA